jgi:hypothetical protein
VFTIVPIGLTMVPNAKVRAKMQLVVISGAHTHECNLIFVIRFGFGFGFGFRFRLAHRRSTFSSPHHRKCTTF